MSRLIGNRYLLISWLMAIQMLCKMVQSLGWACDKSGDCPLQAPGRFLF